MNVGLIQADMDPESRRAAYASDITYVTNSELGFDYLRDNLAGVGGCCCCRCGWDGMRGAGAGAADAAAGRGCMGLWRCAALCCTAVPVAPLRSSNKRVERNSGKMALKA
jgi:hypothetical protein